MPFEPQNFRSSDGIRLAYDDRGEGPALLCLAGLTRNMGDFETVLPLAERCRLIRMDYRGRGASDYPEDFKTYTLQREGQDALELLDHLGIGSAAILGTSRGGLIAMGLAAMAPQRLNGVVLNDVGPEIAARGLDDIMDYIGRRPAPPTLQAMADTMARIATDFPGVTVPRWYRAVAHWYRETPSGLELRYDPRLRDALLAQAEQGELVDLWPFFDAMKDLPLAAIRGANSNLLSTKTFAEMQRRRPDMLAVTVPDRGHVPFLDEPGVVALLNAFIDRLQEQTQ